jgi:ABC-type multidrug transport system ATPase subunit
MTVRENLRFWSKALGLGKSYTKERIAACAGDFGLSDMLDQPARLLSRGKAQRLAIARAVFAEPLVLVLDEPAEGLDPGAVQSLNRALESKVRRGGLVFYSSHHVTDVEGSARTIIEVRDGAVTARPASGGDFLQ